MSVDAREALRLLTDALQAHLEAVANRRGPEDTAVDDAYDAVAEAFERYDEALDDEFGESLPLVIDDLDDHDLDDDDDDEDDDLDDAAEHDDLDPHAEEDEDEMDDDIEEFSLRY